VEVRVGVKEGRFRADRVGEEKNRTLEAPRNSKLVVGKDGQVNKHLY
jgi:hypothetical protein